MMKHLPNFILAALLLAGCATTQPLQDIEQLVAQGRYEEALPRIETVLRQMPTNAEVRMAYATTREKQVNQWLDQAEQAMENGRSGEANVMLKRALALDANNYRGKKLLDAMQAEQRRAEWQIEAETAWARGDGDTAMARIRMILGESTNDPAALKLRGRIEASGAATQQDSRLTEALGRTLSIQFRDASLVQVFEVLRRTAGINFVFDKEVKTDQPITIFMQKTTVKDLLAAVLSSQQLEQRTMDAGTILIYPNTPAKAREHQPLLIKSFYLTNADVKLVANSLRTILKVKDLVADEKLNMLVIRDTPEVLRLTEKMIAMHDFPEPEVMLEVEVLEVSRNRLLNLGIQWPDLLTLTPLASAASGILTLADIIHATASTTQASISSLSLTAGKTDTDLNLLANPRIRARNREVAKIMIGNRVPNITTTATSTGFLAESIQYVDVGLKLEVQPVIHLDNEVAIRINLEVSSIVDKETTTTGTTAYRIGTRNASTVLRLKDGENQVLAGLINDTERNTAKKVPGLSNLPMIGRLFGTQSNEGEKTELMLSITPRLVKAMSRSGMSSTEVNAGTEASLRARDPNLSVFTEFALPSTSAPTTATTPTTDSGTGAAR